MKIGDGVDNEMFTVNEGMIKANTQTSRYDPDMQRGIAGLNLTI